MLTALLPGFREVRTSLVSGALWVASIVLFAIAARPELLRPPYPLSQGALEIIRWLDKPEGLFLLGLAFIAIGQTLSGISGAAVEGANIAWIRNTHIDKESLDDRSWARTAPTYLRPFRPYSGRAVRRLVAYEAVTVADDTRSLLARAYFIAPRFIAGTPEVYQYFERMKGEAEFRDNTLVPLPIFTAALLANIAAPTWIEVCVECAIVTVSIVQFVEARRISRRAHSMIIHRVVDLGLEIERAPRSRNGLQPADQHEEEHQI